ncbi:MAG: hypothetical protein KDI33_12615 [Halioglobus sp.]|nr:hypothetical protein [Halioglobus sp.]
MLTFLLIIAVIAIAIAPLIHFLPSKRQREVAGLREYAAVHGLFVEFRHAPTGGEVSGPIRDVIYYGKRLPSSRASAVESAAWTRDGEGWRSVGRRLPAPAPLEELSVEIIAASVDQFSCGVYWRETEGEAAVEQIRQILERWCALLTQR